MGTFPPIRKTLEGLIDDTRERVTLVERRQLPSRIGPSGRQINDWNLALDDGFYWTNALTLNQPVPVNGASVGYWVGIVQAMFTPGGDIRVLQTAWRSDVPRGPQYQRYLFGTTGVWTAWRGIENGAGSSASLGTNDLDVITTQGQFYQNTVANATIARHYPEAGTAGMLEVFNVGDNDGDQIYQRFTTRPDASATAQRVYLRGKYTTGAWRPWEIVKGPDTGWVTTGLWTAQTDWSVTGYQARKIGNMVRLRFLNLTRTGAAINGSMGDIGNTLAASLTDATWKPGVGTFQLYAANSGRVVSGYIDGNGSIGISAIAAGLTDSTGVIPSGANLSLSGDWFLD